MNETHWTATEFYSVYLLINEYTTFNVWTSFQLSLFFLVIIVTSFIFVVMCGIVLLYFRSLLELASFCVCVVSPLHIIIASLSWRQQHRNQMPYDETTEANDVSKLN